MDNKWLWIKQVQRYGYHQKMMNYFVTMTEIINSSVKLRNSSCCEGSEKKLVYLGSFWWDTESGAMRDSEGAGYPWCDCVWYSGAHCHCAISKCTKKIINLKYLLKLHIGRYIAVKVPQECFFRGYTGPFNIKNSSQVLNQDTGNPT